MVKQLLTVVRTDRKGVTALEYGLIAAFIAVALVAVLPTLQAGLQEAFGDVARALDRAPNP